RRQRFGYPTQKEGYSKLTTLLFQLPACLRCPRSPGYSNPFEEYIYTKRQWFLSTGSNNRRATAGKFASAFVLGRSSQN
ncbi:hypothetical protein M419DRAFT_81648, partial [Trichoderma reesei RUT C-30]